MRGVMIFLLTILFGFLFLLNPVVGVQGLSLVLALFVFLALFARRLSERNILFTQMDLASARIITRFGRIHHIMAMDAHGNMVQRDDEGRPWIRDGEGNVFRREHDGSIRTEDRYGHVILSFSDGRFVATDGFETHVLGYPHGESRIRNDVGQTLIKNPRNEVSILNRDGDTIDIDDSLFEAEQIGADTDPDRTIVLSVEDGLRVEVKPGRRNEVRIIDYDGRAFPLYAHEEVFLNDVCAPATGWSLFRHRPLVGGIWWIGIPLIDWVHWMTSEEYEDGEGEMVPIRVGSLSLREQYVEFAQQTLQTADGAQVIVKGNINIRIVDPFKAIVRVDNYVGALRDRYNALVKSIVGILNVKDLNMLTAEAGGHGSPSIGQQIFEFKRDVLADWGIRVLGIGFEDVTPESPEVKASLAKEAISAADAQSKRNIAAADRYAREQQALAERMAREQQAGADTKYYAEVFAAAGATEGGVDMFKITKIAEAAQGPANTIILDADILRAVSGFTERSTDEARSALASAVKGRYTIPALKRAMLGSGMDPAEVDRIIRAMKRRGRSGGSSSSSTDSGPKA